MDEQTVAENLARMSKAELDVLFKGLPDDHEWFDAVCYAWVLSVVRGEENAWLDLMEFGDYDDDENNPNNPN